MGFAMAAVSAGANIAGGFAQDAQDRGAAAQYKQNAANAMTAADQAENQRRQDLISTLSSVNALRGARGLDATSPTGMAIASNLTQRAQIGINNARLGYLQQASADQVQAKIMGQQGTMALIGGFVKGGQSLFGGLQNAGYLGGGGGGGGGWGNYGGDFSEFDMGV